MDIQVFDNLYVGSKDFRPEAGAFGVINQAIIFADKIADRLYFSEDDDSYRYLNNEEIMTMMRHNYDPSFFGKNEIHINFPHEVETLLCRLNSHSSILALHFMGRYFLAKTSLLIG